jgi:hypothetical protein
VIQLRGIFLNPADAIAAASRGGDVPVCITPLSGREFFALAADPEIVLPCSDPATGAQYTRVRLEACR